MSAFGGGRRVLAAIVPLLATMLLCAAETPDIRIAPLDSVGPRTVGPRTLEKQTQVSLVRDYLQAWQSMTTAFQQQRPEILDGSFVGTAREQLGNRMQEQMKLGIQTLYRDRSHDLRVLFYSPEGLSIQMVDEVEFEVELRDGGKIIGTRHVRTAYMVVLTPAESRWKVRVFQSGAEPARARESTVDPQPLLRKAQSNRAKELLA
jgi:hypothetical protein